MTATSEPTTCTTCGHVGEVDIPSSTAARVGDLLRRSPRLQLKVTRSRAAHTLRGPSPINPTKSSKKKLQRSFSQRQNDTAC